MHRHQYLNNPLNEEIATAGNLCQLPEKLCYGFLGSRTSLVPEGLCFIKHKFSGNQKESISKGVSNIQSVKVEMLTKKMI